MKTRAVCSIIDGGDYYDCVESKTCTRTHALTYSMHWHCSGAASESAQLPMAAARAHKALRLRRLKERERERDATAAICSSTAKKKAAPALAPPRLLQADAVAPIVRTFIERARRATRATTSTQQRQQDNDTATADCSTEDPNALRMRRLGRCEGRVARATPPPEPSTRACADLSADCG